MTPPARSPAATASAGRAWAVWLDDPLWGVGVAVAQLQTEGTAQGLDHRIKNFRGEVDPRAWSGHGPHCGQNGFGISLGARGILWCKTGKQTVT